MFIYLNIYKNYTVEIVKLNVEIVKYNTTMFNYMNICKINTGQLVN